MIREELPGGYVRELRDIKVAKQAKSLFDIPTGFHRREMPHRSAPASSAVLQTTQ